VDGLGHLLATIAKTAVLCIPLGLSLWALLDCAHRSAWIWALGNRSQQVWMASILCGVLVLPVGLAISGYYLVRVRADLVAIEAGEIPESDRHGP
jgi:hypothetical protein